MYDVSRNNLKVEKEIKEICFGNYEMDRTSLANIKISIEPSKQQVDTDEKFYIKVKVYNKTDYCFCSIGTKPVFLSYHWLDETGTKMVVPDGIRTDLNPNLSCKNENDYDLRILSPNQPGDYILRITMLQENVFWFDEEPSNVKTDVRITVEERKWWNEDEKEDIVYGNIELLNRIKYKRYFSFDEKCRPLYLHIETINICNLKCLICPYIKMTRKKEIMSMNLFKKIIDDFCSMGGGDVILTPQVGDIFLDKYLIKRIEYLKNCSKIVSIGFVTNAVAIDRYSDEEMAFILNSCERIDISIYGLNEDEYAKMTRTNNTYDLVIRNIKRILQFKTHCTAILRFRLLKNYSDETIKTWMVHNFDKELLYESLIEYGNWGGALDTNAPLPYDAKWCSSQTARILESGGPCAYPIYHAKVLSNGDVKFCSCVDYDNISENTIGSVVNSSLSEIYNGDLAKEIMAQRPEYV